MTHNTTGKAVDTERNYRYAHKAYSPLSRGGDLYGRGKGSPYSVCMKSIKSRIAPANVAEVHTTTYTLATVDYTPIKAEYKARQEKLSKVTINVKVVKARYIKARGAKTEN